MIFTQIHAFIIVVVLTQLSALLAGLPADAFGQENAPRTPASRRPLPVSPGPDAGSAASRLLGPTRSALPWHSGAWVGGRFTAAGIESFGRFRGSAPDLVTTYLEKDSYANMVTEQWPITTWNGFPGRLNVGLSPLPLNGEGSFESVSRGDQDWVWQRLAQNLRTSGRGDSVVRVGWEMNLRDWKWHTTMSNVSLFKASFRRIVTVMRAEAPGLIFEFGVACGSGLNGSADRLAPLRLGYPGDDVVDLVGCDTYDWWNTEGHDDGTWTKVLRPVEGVGIQDVVDFARAHRKGASFGEWGLSIDNGTNNGGGDNPYYVQQMHRFFMANKDVVAFENYFDEPDRFIANSLERMQVPRSAEEYRRLW